MAHAFDIECAAAPTAPRKHARSVLDNRYIEFGFCARTLQIASLEIKDSCGCVVHVFYVRPHLHYHSGQWICKSHGLLLMWNRAGDTFSGESSKKFTI